MVPAMRSSSKERLKSGKNGCSFSFVGGNLSFGAEVEDVRERWGGMAWLVLGGLDVGGWGERPKR